MNLLEEYLPDLSGHIDGLQYHESQQRLEIVFSGGPDSFKPVLKLTFDGVSNLTEDWVDRDEDSIELAIGLDGDASGYILHTDQRELCFTARVLQADGVNT